MKRSVIILVTMANWFASSAAERFALNTLDRPALAVLKAGADDGISMDSRMVSGSETIVPFSIENGQVIVDVRINDRGPFPMMFDTGTSDALTPEAAAELGLEIKSTGTGRASGERDIPISHTHVASMRLGNAEMTDQPFVVIAVPLYLRDRGSRPPLAGFIGYELLARFAVRLDYEGRTLTLKAARDFRYDGSGARLPFVFTGKTPAAPAAADGIVGTFAIDTGSSGALALRREFVERHGFEARHPSGIRIKAAGVAGAYETIMTRIDRFDIAESPIERPATRFPSNGKGGIPFTDADGSIGYEILRQFVITFDYSRGELWFERSAAFGTKTGQGRTGFQAIKINGPGFRVITVLPNAPAAAAGIRVGDLVTDIDGQPLTSMSQAEFGELTQRPNGTLVHLGLVRDGTPYRVKLILTDVLP
jgi:hypothetical protein